MLSETSKNTNKSSNDLKNNKKWDKNIIKSDILGYRKFKACISRVWFDSWLQAIRHPKKRMNA